VWIAGILILAAYTLISYIRIQRQTETAVLYNENIYQSENVSSPFVLGIFRPRIYLPFNIDEQTFRHVVAHEQAHIRRRDHWWKPIGFLLLMVHWFNPLMWVAYALFCRDIELACDEKVIRELDNQQRADYSQALVSCSINRPTISACPLAFGEVSVRARVKSVMDYRRPKFWIVLLSAALCIAAAACFLTDPKEPDLFHGGLNAEIIGIDPINHIMYVKDINENADVFGERCALDCSQAASRFKLLYANYDSFGDVRDIEFTDFKVGDSIIVTLADSEFKSAFNGDAAAEQVQLGTQRLNDDAEVLAAKAYTGFLAETAMPSVKPTHRNGGFRIFRTKPCSTSTSVWTLTRTPCLNFLYRWQMDPVATTVYLTTVTARFSA
ncbi:MAG: M56 family metallopeptidase, partial [Firmicutes bacterium]|nr:M56 family metallopeptidase [Bacillota bacterium]